MEPDLVEDEAARETPWRIDLQPAPGGADAAFDVPQVFPEEVNRDLEHPSQLVELEGLVLEQSDDLLSAGMVWRSHRFRFIVSLQRGSKHPTSTSSGG
jgi:hypothetical protein